MKMKPYNTGACGMVQMLHAGTVAFDTADIDTGVVLCSLPKYAIVTKAVAVVRTAFNAGTTNVLTVGIETAKNELLGTGDVTAGTVGAYSKFAFVEMGEDVDIYAKFTATGDAATAGEADIFLEIVVAPED